MADEPPPIDSARDMDHLAEVFTVEDDGSHTFSRSVFAITTVDHRAFFGQAPIRKLKLAGKDITDHLKRVPDEETYPEVPARGIMVFSEDAHESVDSAFFVKGPKVGSYDQFQGTGLLPQLLLREVEIFEVLKRHPHPNIVGYHGCIVKQGRIVGIVLDRYPLTLTDRLRTENKRMDENGNGEGQETVKKLDTEACLEGIRAAVQHLHSLGLAHNDITPHNVMMDDREVPVLIDFGSCQPFGNNLITGGTPGWMDEDFTTSAKENDQAALGKLKTWLERRGRVPEQQYPNPC
jgi:serine/threonine protein kinase